MLILIFGLQLAYASRNSPIKGVKSQKKNPKTFSIFFFCFFFFYIDLGATISRGINPRRICRFVHILCDKGLVFVGVQSNNAFHSTLHTITTHQHHHNGTHFSAKALLPTSAGMCNF